MSSSRFPGKVLAPLAGRPIVSHAVDRVSAGVGIENTVVVTSTQASDDPLAAFLIAEGIPMVRGPLDDVYSRMVAALEAHPFDYFFRVSCDSPLVRTDLMQRMAAAIATEPVDLASNVVRRTFPRGHSLELIKAETFRAIGTEPLTAADREHVTPFFYRNIDRFRVLTVEMPIESYGIDGYAVDTVEDLHRIEAELFRGLPSSYPAYTIVPVLPDVAR